MKRGDSNLLLPFGLTVFVGHPTHFLLWCEMVVCARYSLPGFPRGERGGCGLHLFDLRAAPGVVLRRSAAVLQLCGPEEICQAVKEAFSAGGARVFGSPQVLYSQETEWDVTKLDLQNHWHHVFTFIIFFR